MLQIKCLATLHSGGSTIFPKGCGNLRGGGAKLLFGKMFAENCTAMKEIKSKGGGGARDVKSHSNFSLRPLLLPDQFNVISLFQL